MLLAEYLLLLSLDPLSGVLRDARAGRRDVLGAAILLELAALRELVMEGTVLQLRQDLPSYHLIVEEIHKRLRGRLPATPERVLEQRAVTPPDLAAQLLQGLASRDILHRDGRRRFGLFGARSYPIRSMQARRDGEGLLQRALDGPFDLRGCAFLVLLRRTGMAGTLLDLPMEQAIGRRLGQLHRQLHAADSEIPQLDRKALHTLWCIGEALEARLQR